ncbi:MAG: DUF763 domain-containing protein [Candidatus Omnitrophica bacterium]|nr:DUF763 domain-containing protein [Candidatus Omnitrophota bacterium]
MRRSSLDLPLHTGKCPAWLFAKMQKLSGLISEAIIIEQGPDAFLEKLSSAFWFQAFGCVLGFDWHSSGLTTTVCGALKEAFRDLTSYGIYVCGGKGRTSRKTPHEIEVIAQRKGFNPENLVYASRMSAKVDNSCLQDGFQLYHHSFIFTKAGKWAVVQQGMSEKGAWARRYHWFSSTLESFVSEPHNDIVSDKNLATLNMVDAGIPETRKICAGLAAKNPQDTLRFINTIKPDKLPLRHKILASDLNSRYLKKIFLTTYQKKPRDFEELVSIEGVGPKTIRALALTSELVYGAPLSFKDPARFSFAHGGKDGYPYKISQSHYQKTIDVLEKAVKKAKIERTDKIRALKRLFSFYGNY